MKLLVQSKFKENPPKLEVVSGTIDQYKLLTFKFNGREYILPLQSETQDDQYLYKVDNENSYLYVEQYTRETSPIVN